MPKFIVTVARDLSEYADVAVDAADADAAETLALEAARKDPRELTWSYGDDRESVYVADSEEKP
jgi:hypothetical protein